MLLLSLSSMLTLHSTHSCPFDGLHDHLSLVNMWSFIKIEVFEILDDDDDKGSVS